MSGVWVATADAGGTLECYRVESVEVALSEVFQLAYDLAYEPGVSTNDRAVELAERVEDSIRGQLDRGERLAVAHFGAARPEGSPGWLREDLRVTVEVVA